MNKICSIVCISVACVLIVIGAFLDLNITQGLYVGENAFSTILEIMGQTFMTFLSAFCLVMLFQSNKDKNTFWFTVLKVCEIVGAVILVFYDFYKIYDAKWFLICAIFVSVLIVYIMWIVWAKIPQEKVMQYKSFCIKFLIFIAIIYVLNQGIKYLWGRPRYTDLITSLSTADFSPFWQPHFFSGYKSFYSGHTTAVCSLLPLIALFNNSNISKKKQVIFNSVIIGFIFLTMFSRLLAGDHFLSDVSFALLICTLVCMIVFKKTRILQ